MDMYKSVSLALVLAVSAPVTFAQSDEVKAPPPLTEEDLSKQINTEAIEIRPQKKPTEGVVREYGDENGTYLLEVQPAYGASYYMLDADGDGSPGEYRQNIERENSVGKWRLGEW